MSGIERRQSHQLTETDLTLCFCQLQFLTSSTVSSETEFKLYKVAQCVNTLAAKPAIVENWPVCIRAHESVPVPVYRFQWKSIIVQVESVVLVRALEPFRTDSLSVSFGNRSIESLSGIFGELLVDIKVHNPIRLVCVDLVLVGNSFQILSDGIKWRTNSGEFNP